MPMARTGAIVAALVALAGCGGDEPVVGPGGSADAGGADGGGQVLQDVLGGLPTPHDALGGVDGGLDANGQVDAGDAHDAAQADAGCQIHGGCPQPGDPCRVAVCQDDGSCKLIDAPAGAACDDGDMCTGPDGCDGGACAGPSLTCDDANPCTDDGCDKAKGCLSTANTAACDDGNACTHDDACGGGVCLPGEASPCQDDNPCTDDGCDPKSGCQWVWNGLPCEDGDVCTGGDACAQGACEPGAAVDCGDANPCTDDVCDGIKGCLSKPNSAQCSDNNVCTQADTCAGGVCVPGVSKSCDDANPCTDDSCHTVNGCVHSPNIAACKDGDACTTGDACKGGDCASGDGLGCDDGNPCTTDTCDKIKGCLSKANSAACDDGSACTTADQCANGQCQPGAPKGCDDGNLCTHDACDPLKGCVHTFNTVPCGDDNACTGGDGCKGGKCQPGAKTSCDDGNPCTDDGCDKAKGCVHEDNTAACTDNNACTLADKCKGGQCQPGAAKGCEDGNACTADGCHPTLGCVHTPNTLACDDGDACTASDTCAGGGCKAGKQVTCSDGNPCTTDTCDKTKGCQFAPHGEACDDGSVCTVQDGCAGGVCKPGPPKKCDDANPCTADTCDTAKGCVHSPNQAPCSDGSVCTVGDVCKNGGCEPGTEQACDDANPCTDDGCDKAKGCVSQPNTAACDDGNACTVKDTCGGGVCKGGAVDCDDGNACTVDVCDVKQGCQHSAPAGFEDCGGKCLNTLVDPANCGKCGETCKAGSLCIGGGCKAIVCIPYSKGGCYTGADGTAGVGACKAGERTCNTTGTAWLPGCVGEVTPALAEDCDTPQDDDCDGVTNEPSICGPAEYIFGSVPNCGSYCYYDEAHNLAVSGSATDNSGVGKWALGQLLDGKRGVDSWSSDLGAGPAWEWVGWSKGNPVVTFRFPKLREVSVVTVGLNNFVSGGVRQPLAVHIATSADGKSWGKTSVFAQADGTLPKIPAGKRADLKLTLPKQQARYLRMTFMRTGWTFVDEVVLH